MSDARPRRRVFPSARVIDPLNAGDKEVSSHRNAFELARQREEEELDSDEQQCASASATPAVLTPTSSFQSAPNPDHSSQPGLTAGAPKRSLTQASLDSTESVNLKRKLSPADDCDQILTAGIG